MKSCKYLPISQNLMMYKCGIEFEMQVQFLYLDYNSNLFPCLLILYSTGYDDRAYICKKKSSETISVSNNQVYKSQTSIDLRHQFCYNINFHRVQKLMLYQDSAVPNSELLNPLHGISQQCNVIQCAVP